ncbi:MAG: hypothetical protein V8T10_02470 [Merdibacter sp.]
MHSAPCQQDHGPTDADDVPEVSGEGARGCRRRVEGDLYRARREEDVAGNVADLIDGEDRWNDERTQQPQRDDRPQQERNRAEAGRSRKRSAQMTRIISMVSMIVT